MSKNNTTIKMLRTYIKRDGGVRVVRIVPVNGVLANGVTMFATSEDTFLHLYYDYDLKQGVISVYSYTRFGRFLLKHGIWRIGITQNRTNTTNFRESDVLEAVNK